MPTGEEERLGQIVNFDIIVIRNHNELVNDEKARDEKQGAPTNAYSNNNNKPNYQNKEGIMPVVIVEMWEGRIEGKLVSEI